MGVRGKVEEFMVRQELIPPKLSGRGALPESAGTSRMSSTCWTTRGRED
jgi:hypothetical protein